MSEKTPTPEVDKFTALVVGLKRAVDRSVETGRPTSTDPTPEIDSFLKDQQIQAGSKPREERTE